MPVVGGNRNYDQGNADMYTDGRRFSSPSVQEPTAVKSVMFPVETCGKIRYGQRLRLH
jgi:hypothetical protein